MLGWFRRREGFEWREHVRTTVLVRRAGRERKLDDARMAALAKVHNIGKQGRDAGFAGFGMVIYYIKTVAIAAGRSLARLGVALWRSVAGATHTMWAALTTAVLAGAEFSKKLWRSRPEFSGLLSRFKSFKKPAGKLPLAARLNKKRPAPSPHARASYWAYAPGAAAALGIFSVALGSAYLAGGPRFDAVVTKSKSSSRESRAMLAPITTGTVSRTDYTGRANVLSGDTLSISGTVIKLEGIEAPAPSQSCLNKGGRSWDCGNSAVTALKRLTRGRTVTCEQRGGSGNTPIAYCTAGGTDLAASLVRNGHVFAEAGLFTRYSSTEGAAKTEGLGIWKGRAERPADWRAARWAEAKAQAPGGCPIKGHVRASGLVYSLPWSKDYDAAKIKTEIGERWFCSEDEARAAGWKPSS